MSADFEPREVLLQLAALSVLLDDETHQVQACDAATARLETLLSRRTGPVRLHFSMPPGGTVTVDGRPTVVPEGQRAAVARLALALAGAGLSALELNRDVSAALLRDWLSAVRGRGGPLDHPRFAPIRTVAMKLPPMAAPPTPPPRLIRAGEESQVRVGPPEPVGIPEDPGSARPRSGLSAEMQPLESPHPGRTRRVQDVVEALVEAALRFEQTLALLASGRLDPAGLVALAYAADRLTERAEDRVDLAVAALRVRARGTCPLTEAGLHAAGTACISTLLGRAVGLRGEARRILGRAALAATLPHAFGKEEPADELLEWAEARARAAELCALLPAEVVHYPEPWWTAAWVAAVAYRAGRTGPDGSLGPPVARVVAVAAAYDIALAGPCRQHTPRAALEQVARAGPARFDPVYVTALAAVVGVGR